MTPAKLGEIESRLRDAYTDAAAAIRRDDLRPYVPERHAPRRGGLRRRRTTPFVQLAAAASVAAVAVAAVLISGALHSGSKRLPTPDQNISGAPPRYVLTIPRYISTYFDVESAVSGKVAANIWAPDHGQWSAVATEGGQGYIATDLIESITTGHRFETYFYRITLTSAGKLASERRIGGAISGFISGLSVTPNGRYAAYLIGGNPPEFALDLKNLVTGKLIASWPQHGAGPDSLSIDAAGNAVAISAYEYKPREDNSLLQWTSVLHASTKNGSPLIDLPEIDHQDAALALSPDGKIMYEFLQTGHVTDTSWQSKKPVTFDLAAISTATGKVVSVLHSWRAVWADFNPQLALAPGGGYLLVANAHSLARIDLATGRYTPLPGKINWFETTIDAGYPATHDPTDLDVIYVDPLAW